MSADAVVLQIANALALAAAGAFTGLTSINVNDCSEASVCITYTQGAAGGTPTVRVSWTPSVLTTGYATAPGDHIGVVNSAGLTLVAEEWILANPGSSPYARVLHFKVPPGMAALVIAVAESGVVGTPGTLSAWAATRS